MEGEEDGRDRGKVVEEREGKGEKGMRGEERRVQLLMNSPMLARQAMIPKASQTTSESWRKLSRIFKRSSRTLMPMRYCFCSSLQL